MPEAMWGHPAAMKNPVDIMPTMNPTSDENVLYLAVLPMISLGGSDFGKTGQFLTLLPQRILATEFFSDEVDSFIRIFENRTKYLIGGHVTGFDVSTEPTSDGRVVVRVVQNVG